MTEGAQDLIRENKDINTWPGAKIRKEEPELKQFSNPGTGHKQGIKKPIGMIGQIEKNIIIAVVAQEVVGLYGYWAV